MKLSEQIQVLKDKGTNATAALKLIKQHLSKAGIEWTAKKQEIFNSVYASHPTAKPSMIDPKILKVANEFMGHNQLSVVKNCLRGEEGAYFKEVLDDLYKTVTTMPKTYQTEKQGKNAIVYLHYFHGNMDWYITEVDKEPEQHQAFGYADLGYGGELGYISIVELVHNNIELDFHWTPKPLHQIKDR